MSAKLFLKLSSAVIAGLVVAKAVIEYKERKPILLGDGEPHYLVYIEDEIEDEI